MALTTDVCAMLYHFAACNLRAFLFTTRPAEFVIGSLCFARVCFNRDFSRWKTRAEGSAVQVALGSAGVRHACCFAGRQHQLSKHVSTHTPRDHLLQFSAMALPKSMRLLGLLSLCIFGYLLFLVFSTPAEIQPPPSTGKLEKMTKDPNLERTTL
jgi:hypothetical protein